MGDCVAGFTPDEWALPVAEDSDPGTGGVGFRARDRRRYGRLERKCGLGRLGAGKGRSDERYSGTIRYVGDGGRIADPRFTGFDLKPNCLDLKIDFSAPVRGLTENMVAALPVPKNRSRWCLRWHVQTPRYIR